MAKLVNVPYKPQKSGKDAPSLVKALAVRRLSVMDYFSRCGRNKPVDFRLLRLFLALRGV